MESQATYLPYKVGEAYLIDGSPDIFVTLINYRRGFDDQTIRSEAIQGLGQESFILVPERCELEENGKVELDTAVIQILHHPNITIYPEQINLMFFIDKEEFHVDIDYPDTEGIYGFKTTLRLGKKIIPHDYILEQNTPDEINTLAISTITMGIRINSEVCNNCPVNRSCTPHMAFIEDLN